MTAGIWGIKPLTVSDLLFVQPVVSLLALTGRVPALLFTPVSVPVGKVIDMNKLVSTHLWLSHELNQPCVTALLLLLRRRRLTFAEIVASQTKTPHTLITHHTLPQLFCTQQLRWHTWPSKWKRLTRSHLRTPAHALARSLAHQPTNH